MANNAERNGPFIRHFMENIGSCMDMKIDDVNGVPTTRGLYVFYVKFNPDSEERYPIYAGITRRSFRQRFKEHAMDGNLIDKVQNNQFPRNYGNLGLYAYMVPLPAIASKFLESILLEAYDFCLNTDENVGVRENLDFVQGQFTPEQSKHNFDITWKNVMDTLKGLAQMYQI